MKDYFVKNLVLWTKHFNESNNQNDYSIIVTCCIDIPEVDTEEKQNMTVKKK